MNGRSVRVTGYDIITAVDTVLTLQKVMRSDGKDHSVGNEYGRGTNHLIKGAGLSAATR